LKGFIANIGYYPALLSSLYSPQHNLIGSITLYSEVLYAQVDPWDEIGAGKKRGHYLVFQIRQTWTINRNEKTLAL